MMRTPRILLGVVCAAASWAGEWSDPVEVHHDDDLCLSYRAKLNGEYLIVRASIEPGWHTFAMDNKRRADEKLAGKKSLGIDRPTEIALSGLQASGPWRQSAPEDFSKPELRWFSWGFERQALFVVKVRRSGAAARLAIRGQACTETICRNIDVAISLPVAKMKTDDSPEIEWKDLVPVR